MFDDMNGPIKHVWWHEWTHLTCLVTCFRSTLCLKQVYRYNFKHYEGKFECVNAPEVFSNSNNGLSMDSSVSITIKPVFVVDGIV